jgi:predicted nucleotidyltransferase component of viral defense system
MAALTDLQDEILRRFFAARSEFFLTGGAALAGFHLHHRSTHDLDLFTTAMALDDGERTLRDIARDLALAIHSVRRSPDFRRFLLKGEGESVVVDLVRDVTPQLFEKVVVAGIRVDPAEEILANKLCALLSRTEPRDLVDVARLEQAGHDPVAAVERAEKKDGGMSASQLAWVLSTFAIPKDESALHGMTRADLTLFRDSLVDRLVAKAFPGR